jgi:hypothetical protein
MSSTRIAAAATAVLIAVSGAVTPSAPALAAGQAVTVPARDPDGGLVGPPVTVAARSFPAGPRFVSAAVTAGHATGSTRRATMLSVKLVCGSESVQATTNVLTTVVLTPRRLMTDPADCRVIANSAVNDATAGDGLRVTTTITAAGVGWGRVGYRPDGWPAVLEPGEAYDAVPVTTTVPAGVRSARVVGDVKVTTCTSVGGSRENGSPYLCDPARLDRGGTRLKATLVAAQRRKGGGYCVVKAVSARTVHVGAKVHHAMIAQAGTYTLSRSSTCTREVMVKVYVRVLGGADVLVHRRGTITNVYG